MNNNNNNKEEYYTKSELINSTRTLSALSILLFLAFSIVDIWAISSSLPEVLLVRAGVIFALLTTYGSTYTPFFYKYKDIVMPSVIFVAALGIEYMVYVASPADHAYSVYFVGLVLILMTLYSWTYIKFAAAITITISVVCGYIYIEQFTRPTSAKLTTFELATNLFFIISAVIIGLVARGMRDRFMYENHLLQESLAQKLEDKTEEAKDHLYKANHDELTGLANRRHVTEQLENSLQIAKEKDKILLILFIDLNGFKQINDIYGHAAGDEVLTIVARRLELAVRGSDSLSRLGGDEFLVGLLIEKDHLSDVEPMVEKYVKIISAPMNIDGQRLKVGASIGMAAYPIHGNKVSILMDIADKKMYQVKHGRADKESDQNQKNEPVVIFPGNIRQK